MTNYSPDNSYLALFRVLALSRIVLHPVGTQNLRVEMVSPRQECCVGRRDKPGLEVNERIREQFAPRRDTVVLATISSCETHEQVSLHDRRAF